MSGRVAQYVTLKGGPCDGLRVLATLGQSLLMEDSAEPGKVARYRPGRAKGTYTFRGFDTIVAVLPSPGGDKP